MEIDHGMISYLGDERRAGSSYRDRSEGDGIGLYYWDWSRSIHLQHVQVWHHYYLIASVSGVLIVASSSVGNTNNNMYLHNILLLLIYNWLQRGLGTKFHNWLLALDSCRPLGTQLHAGEWAVSPSTYQSIQSDPETWTKQVVHLIWISHPWVGVA